MRHVDASRRYAGDHGIVGALEESCRKSVTITNDRDVILALSLRWPRTRDGCSKALVSTRKPIGSGKVLRRVGWCGAESSAFAVGVCLG